MTTDETELRILKRAKSDPKGSTGFAFGEGGRDMLNEDWAVLGPALYILRVHDDIVLRLTGVDGDKTTWEIRTGSGLVKLGLPDVPPARLLVGMAAIYAPVKLQAAPGFWADLAALAQKVADTSGVLHFERSDKVTVSLDVNKTLTHAAKAILMEGFYQIPHGGVSDDFTLFAMGSVYFQDLTEKISDGPLAWKHPKTQHPAVEMRDGKGQWFGSATIREDHVGELIDPDEMQASLDRVWKSIEDMGEDEVDTMIILSTFHYERGGNPKEPVIISLNELIRRRGIKPNKGQGRIGYKRETRTRYLEALHTLLFKMELTLRLQNGKVYQGPAFQYGGKIGQYRLPFKVGDFIEPDNIIFTPGPVFGHLMYTADWHPYIRLHSKVLQFNPYRQKPHRRLGRYLCTMYRLNPRDIVYRHRIATLLKRAGINTERRNRKDIVEKLESILDYLKKEVVLNDWNYDVPL